ncbi:hypothetical protein SLEP1_g49598 [Rubroshorea leprosula]|uniref:CCHC-type domain-containing protein n=1 Tax=Rubroshorea leprosula TaxID=152421 RepID=A0AAV5LZU2_9ROSI|nr:hypothetical protein SLEP1_g49598 [Rubroshorea leprosula]
MDYRNVTAPKRRGRSRGGHKDQGTPPIPTACPFAQATPQEEGMSNPQMATFVQEFMAEMRGQASSATSVPPPSLVVSTPMVPAPISSTPAVPSWKVGSWITEVEKGFRLLKISDDLKVDVGSYMLTDEALTWWESYLKLHQGEPELSTYDDLKQGSRTIEQYKKEFDRYLPFVGSKVGDEQAKADRFLWGLNPAIYLAVNQFKLAFYREAADRAINQEKAMARVKTPDPHKSDTSKGSKELRVAKTVGQASATQRIHPAPPICHTCGRVGHTRDQCHITTRACFRCGKQGHRVANCPQPDPKAQNT